MFSALVILLKLQILLKSRVLHILQLHRVVTVCGRFAIPLEIITDYICALFTADLSLARILLQRLFCNSISA